MIIEFKYKIFITVLSRHPIHGSVIHLSTFCSSNSITSTTFIVKTVQKLIHNIKSLHPKIIKDGKTNDGIEEWQTKKLIIVIGTFIVCATLSIISTDL